MTAGYGLMAMLLYECSPAGVIRMFLSLDLGKLELG